MQIYGAACTRKQVAENTKETRTNRAAEFCCCGVCADDVGVEVAVRLCHFFVSVPEAYADRGYNAF